MLRIILMLLCLLSFRAQTKPPPYRSVPYTTTYVYDVDVVYPNFIVSTFAFFGELFGTVERPNRVYYKERVLCNTSSECFELTIRTDQQKTWLFVVGSDSSSKRSFSDLPQNDKFFLAPDAVDFIVQLRSFLNDSLGTTFRDTFFYEDQYLVAYVVQRKDLGRKNIRHVEVTTIQRDSLEKPYLDAQIEIYETENKLYYTSVHVHLENKDVRITLSLSDIYSEQ